MLPYYNVSNTEHFMCSWLCKFNLFEVDKSSYQHITGVATAANMEANFLCLYVVIFQSRMIQDCQRNKPELY